RQPVHQRDAARGTLPVRLPPPGAGCQYFTLNPLGDRGDAWQPVGKKSGRKGREIGPLALRALFSGRGSLGGVEVLEWTGEDACHNVILVGFTDFRFVKAARLQGSDVGAQFGEVVDIDLAVN